MPTHEQLVPTLALQGRTAWRKKWLIALAAALAVLLLMAAFVATLMPSDEDLARRAEIELSALFGVKTTVGTAGWQLLPQPTITLRDIVTDQPKPITIRMLTLVPDLALLLQKRVRLTKVNIEGAVVPQLSLSGLGQNPALAAPRFTLDSLPLGKLVLEQLSWVSRHGVAITLAGEVNFDTGWRPSLARLRLPEAKVTTAFEVRRQDSDDVWAITSQLGGGSLNGQVQLDTTQSGLLRLAGKLKPQGIEVSSMLEAFNRRPVVAGKASGQTVLSAQGASVAELVRALRTQTSFAMGASNLLRFDLDRAVRTLGRQHAGQTPLDSLTGQLVTQNSASGMALSFTNLNAASGALTASGSARVQNQRIQAELAVDLVEGMVGVPLTISGPLANVAVSMPAGALVGAAVGTAVLPGVGTAIGARVGAAIGNIFGGLPERAVAPLPQARPQRP